MFQGAMTEVREQIRAGPFLVGCFCVLGVPLNKGLLFIVAHKFLFFFPLLWKSDAFYANKPQP